MLSADGVPSSYDELIANYTDYVKGLCRLFGVKETDDAAQSILLRFFEADRMAMWDPTIVSHGKQTNYRAFIRAFVEAKCRHLREREGVRAAREPVKCDMPVGSGKQVWVELYQVPEPDFADQVLQPLEESATILLIRERLSEIPERGRRDLLVLFDLMLPQIQETGQIDRKELSRQYGVSTSVIGSMIQEIRQAISFLSPA
jgi:hypothetical protein